MSKLWLQCRSSDFGDGLLHQSIEDMVLMRAIPNMTVLFLLLMQLKTCKMVKAMVDWDGLVYIRI